MRTSRGNTNRIVGREPGFRAVGWDSRRCQSGLRHARQPSWSHHRSRVVKSVPYTITRDISWVSGGANNSPCDGSATATSAYVRVTIAVPGAPRGIKPVTTQTVIAPPVGVYDPNTGNAGIKILSAAGKPQTNIKVELTGPGGAEIPQYTTVDGCAFFPFLEPVRTPQRSAPRATPTGRACLRRRRRSASTSRPPPRSRSSSTSSAGSPPRCDRSTTPPGPSTPVCSRQTLPSPSTTPASSRSGSRSSPAPGRPAASRALPVHRRLRRLARKLSRRRSGPVRHKPPGSGNLGATGRDIGS